MHIDYEDLIGKPFKYGGRGREGYDCYGLVQEVYRRFGIDLPEIESPDNICTITGLINGGVRVCDKIDEPEYPCIVTFWVKNPKFTSHVGVVIEPDRFLHITEKNQAVIGRLSSPLWNKRITGYFRWKKTTNYN